MKINPDKVIKRVNQLYSEKKLDKGIYINSINSDTLKSIIEVIVEVLNAPEKFE